MSEVVRRVSSPGGVEEDGSTAWTCPTMWLDRPDGTHALVPWETWERVVADLEDMVWQHCQAGVLAKPPDELHSMCLSANAGAMRTLATLGRLEITSEYGRGVIARRALAEIEADDGRRRKTNDESR